jgi:hypothetical protein
LCISLLLYSWWLFPDGDGVPSGKLVIISLTVFLFSLTVIAPSRKFVFLVVQSVELASWNCSGT